MKTKKIINERILFMQHQFEKVEQKALLPGVDGTKLGIEAGMLDAQIDLLKWVLEDSE